MNYIDRVISANSLIRAFKQRVYKSSGWKDATQRYECNLLRETWKLRQELLNEEYKQQEGATFRLVEQGRVRLIRALTVRDMVTQHALCDEVLYPELTKYLIYDNGASIKGKGLGFTRKRFERHLREFFRRYGKSGYVLKIDYRKFFDNIRHDKLLENVGEKLKDEKLLRLLRSMLEAYQVDVSYSDDPDIIDKVHNSLEYQKLDKSLFTGKRFMPKSLGIGAPISQVCGIFYLNMVDSYCKTVLGLRYYDVYMDDRIILHHDKRFLHELLQDIERISVCLGLHVNRDKTQIIPISHGFTFLKTRYLVTDTGRIIKKIPKSVVTRERRKLKKLARFVENGSMTLDQFHEQYRSWRGDKRMYNAHKTIATLDILHRRLTKWIMRNRNSSARSSRKSST